MQYDRKITLRINNQSFFFLRLLLLYGYRLKGRLHQLLVDDFLHCLVLWTDRHCRVYLLPCEQGHVYQEVLPQLRLAVQVAVQKVLLVLWVVFQDFNALGMQFLFVKLDYFFESSAIKLKLHFPFCDNVLLVNHLSRSDPLPGWLELLLGNSCRLDELHVIDIDFLSDQVRLLQPCVVIEVYVPVNHSELVSWKSQLSPQHHTLLRSQIYGLSLFQHHRGHWGRKLDLYVQQVIFTCVNQQDLKNYVVLIDSHESLRVKWIKSSS